MEGEKGRQRLTIVGSAPAHGLLFFIGDSKMTEVEKLKKEIENLKTELEKEKNCYFKIDENFFYIKVREANLLKENQNLQYELNRMQEENARLEKENEDIQNSHMKLYNDTKDEIRELKVEIERLRGKCREVPCERCDCSCDNKEIEIEALIYELQDQHQQDCIRYNDMRTAFLKAVDELAMLRKQFGVGQ